MERVGEPVSERSRFPKSRLAGKPQDRLASLEMGIEDNLGDGEDPSRFQCKEKLLQRSFPVRYFSKDGNQQCTVELVVPQFPFADSSSQIADIPESMGIGFFLDPLEHPFLDIHGDDSSDQAEFHCKRNG